MASLPSTLAGRQLLPGGTPAWTPAYRNATQVLFARYSGMPALELHVAHYPSQSQEAELINVNNLVADGETWSVVPGSESETPNVSFLGHRDRAMMSIERLSAETGFRPRAAREDVFGEFVDWLVAHRRYYE